MKLLDMKKQDYTNGYWNYSLDVPLAEIESFSKRLVEWQAIPENKRGPLFVPQGITFVDAENLTEKLDL